MTRPSDEFVEIFRAQLHSTVDHIADRWVTIAELRAAPDTPTVECETRAPKATESGTFYLHVDPVGDSIENKYADWLEDMQYAVSLLGRLDTDSAKLAEPLETPTHCPVCGEPLAGKKVTWYGRNGYHVGDCYKRAIVAMFRPGRW